MPKRTAKSVDGRRNRERQKRKLTNFRQQSAEGQASSLDPIQESDVQHYDELLSGNDCMGDNLSEQDIAAHNQTVGRRPHSSCPNAAQNYQPSLNTLSLGPMSHVCPYCDAKRFKNEQSNCCHNGKVHLQPLSPYPALLRDLLEGQNETSKNFVKHIRNYNSSFAFASMGAMMAPPPGHGPYCFRIHGQVYHRTGNLHPPPNQRHQYGQIYILDGPLAAQTRLEQPQNEHCQEDVMKSIHEEMLNINPYAIAYKHMYEVETEENAKAQASNYPPPTVTMVMKKGTDQRRYNLPTQDEVAAVFVGEDGIPPDRDFIVYPKDKPLQVISTISPNIDPMTYPILFPHGERGWMPGIPHQSQHQTAKRKTVTMLQFYSFRLAIREQFSPIHKSGKLFQQYVVDAYVKTESTRLFYLRQNQSKLRVEQYQGLMDQINHTTDHAPGRMVILPSTFQGSPRAMHQNYLDAMSIVAHFGKPDLFLTFTCNPQWSEIKSNLLPHQQSSDRPDLVSRVFHLKLNNLIKDITHHHIFGKPVAWVHVIEFQKRGLPHCHMLIILDQDHKLRQPEDVDRLIKASIPNPTEDPELYDIVKSTMVHGPCGVLNPKAVCMKEGECTKDFPKKFQARTTISNDGYPHYARPDNKRTVTIKHKELDNRWIVPYSPYLSKKYQAHINLEACMSIKSVKYLYKYIYKGYDCATLQTTQTTANHDEISSFLDARYVSAPEGFWRLSEYPMQGRSHVIHRLPVHLANKQPVYFVRGQEEEALARANNKRSKLSAWFQLNKEDEDANQYLYTEIPNHYVFNAKASKWQKRQRKMQSVQRMYNVSPKDEERFFLRLLLLHVPGAKSYEDLKTINGTEASTFKEACIKLNLLEDDKVWDDTLAEASAYKMPRQMRLLFATIIAHNHPTDVLALWKKHESALTEDLQRTFPQPQASHHALAHIDDILKQHGLSCRSLGLPMNDLEESQIQHLLPNEHNQFDDPNVQMNEDQQHVINTILNCQETISKGMEPTTTAFFLDGPGGTGKTTLYNRLIATFHEKNLKVSATAYTGIAATLLHKGQTIHSFYKLPVPVNEGSTCNVPPQSQQAQRVRDTDLFIIDEASMVPKHALDAINMMLQDVMENNKPFGGKIVLLGGDFRQVLPVIPRVAPAVLIENTIKKSNTFQQFHHFKLTKNMRANADEKQFAEWLLQVGEGRCHSENDSLPTESIILPSSVITNDIVKDMYDDSSNVEKEAILTPKNDATFIMNEQILQKIPGDAQVYYSTDTISTEDNADVLNYPSEFVNSLTPSGLPQHKLQLKKGAIVMLLRNLDIKDGLCNGTRLKICNLYNNVIDAQVLTTGKRVLIPRIKLTPSDTTLPFNIHRVQFPVRLAYCMTINKAQGQTFSRVGLYLPYPVFSHGQLYVALSRAKSLNSIRVKIENTAEQGKKHNRYYTKNIVYHEVLN